MKMHNSRWQAMALLASCALMGILATTAAGQQQPLPNVMILATGGTIAAAAPAEEEAAPAEEVAAVEETAEETAG